MRLINYGTGEVADRLTILGLKILFGKAAGKTIAHFEREQAQLLPKISARLLTSKVFEQTIELAAVNGALWHAEDSLRMLRQQQEGTRAVWSGFGVTWAEAVAKVAIRIQELNDRRSELVALINTNTGEQLGDEKVT